MQKAKTRSLLLPGRALFIASLLYLVLGCAAFFFDPVFIAWVLAGAGLVPFVVIDLFLLILLTDRLSSQRQISSSLAQYEDAKVRLLIRRTGVLLPSSIRLYDLHPDTMTSAIFPAKLDRKLFRDADAVVFDYNLIPQERGPWLFCGAEFMLGSLLRLWCLRVTHNTTSHGRTYPNFKQLAGGTAIKGKPQKGDIR